MINATSGTSFQIALLPSLTKPDGVSVSCQLLPRDSRLGEPGMDVVLKIDFARPARVLQIPQEFTQNGFDERVRFGSQGFGFDREESFVSNFFRNLNRPG